MSVTIQVQESGTALLVVNRFDTTSVEGFVDEVSSLVQDRDEVNHVAVQVAGEPSDLLRYLVRVLDRQARVLGKTVELEAHPA